MTVIKTDNGLKIGKAIFDHAKKYLAIVHDGTHDGDSRFNPWDGIPFPEVFLGTGLAPIDAIISAYTKQEKANIDDDEDPDFATEHIKDIKGAWIIEKDTYDKIDKGTNHSGGGDGEMYLAIRITKQLIHIFSVANIGEEAEALDQD